MSVSVFGGECPVKKLLRRNLLKRDDACDACLSRTRGNFIQMQQQIARIFINA
ncbi:hypothetical protein R69919_00903 [Paraburkholderia gardini]|nr:hypothetical protein R69919_00903 [Paraburkholderia gardini]